MMDRLMDIKEKDVAFLSKPFSSEVNKPSTINEEE